MESKSERDAVKVRAEGQTRCHHFSWSRKVKCVSLGKVGSGGKVEIETASQGNKWPLK